MRLDISVPGARTACDAGIGGVPILDEDLRGPVGFGEKDVDRPFETGETAAHVPGERAGCRFRPGGPGDTAQKLAVIDPAGQQASDFARVLEFGEIARADRAGGSAGRAAGRARPGGAIR